MENEEEKEKNCYLGEGDALGIWFYSRKASMWELPRSMGGVWVQMFIRPNSGKRVSREPGAANEIR